MLVSNLEVSGSIRMHGGGITGSVTGSFRGEYSGSGANLYDISASSIVGLNLSRISSGSVTASIEERNGFVVKSSASGSTFTGSVKLISGSYSGSGANLSNIPASAIVGLNLSRISTGSATASLHIDAGGTSSFQVNTNAAITGSLTVGYRAGSGIVSGTNVFGTASWADNARNANLLSGSSFRTFVNTGSSNATQAITGSLLITQNLTVQGSSSFTYVTASQILVDQNTLTVFGSGSALPTAGYVVADTASWNTSSLSFDNTSSFLYNLMNREWTLGNSLIVSGTLKISQSITAESFTGSLEGTSSWAVSASISTWAKNAPRRFIVPGEIYELRENFEMYVFDLYNYGTLYISSGSLVLPFGTGSIRNDGSVVTTLIYNAGTIINEGAFQIVSHSI